jgi:hypothetical protein
VIVHNRYSADRLRDLGVRVPIHVVPHPYEPHEEARSRRDEIRAKHGFTAEHRIIGMFGFLTSAKRSEVVLEAFAQAWDDMPNLQLLIVGEPAPDVDIIALGAEGVTFTGYAPDEDFPAYFAAVDRLVNLRFPTAGETSGTLIRAFEAGKPVAVSDYAQFAELPDECVVKIPFGDREIGALADFFKRHLEDPSEAQQRWLKQKARMELTVAGYLAALQDSALSTQHSALVVGSLPLFPSLELVSRDASSITIRNGGDSTLRARSYGEPGYRIIANGHWLDLPGDLKPGGTATIDLPTDLRDRPLELFHAMQGIPDVDPKAWVRVAIH